MSIKHIKNVAIVTLDTNDSIYHNTNLVITDNQITYMGDDLPKDFQPDEVIDGTNKVVMPGLFNSHCHASMTLLRGSAEDMYFQDWLPKIWQIENKMTPDDIYWGAALAAAEMIRTGTVGFNDMYFHMDRVAAVVDQSGMKATLGWTVFDPGEGTEIGAALAETKDWLADVKTAANDRIKSYLAPHAPYTCSEPMLRKIVETAHEGQYGIHLHVSESLSQVEESLKKYALRPVQYLDQLGVFDAPGGCVAAHGLYLDETDISILSRKGVHVPHCPITYMKLAMPFFSLKSSLDSGVKVCLGTDGAASNSDMDMFAVIRHTGLTQKMLQQDPTFLSGSQLLRLATQAGAETLGFDNSGSIEVGKAADLIMIDLDTPHARPVNNLVANLIYSVKGSDVTDVLVNGNWLMRKRELLTIDEEELLYETQIRASRLMK